jgi:predicted transposase/invertase (TIGR01784 family)
MQNKVLEKFMNLKITNVWMFPKVFGDPDNIELSREMIKRCIGREVEEIKLIVPESTETAGYETHGVRYDVKFKGEDKLYIVEMQNYTDSLIKRGNYEASVAMVDSFDPSDDYDNVQNIMVIYICTFDYYGINEARYVVEQKVVGHGELNVNTNLSIIILNTTARSEDKELDSMMRYFNDTRTEDAFTTKLEETVKKIKEKQITRGDYMTLEYVIKQERKLEAEEVTKKVTEEVQKADAIEFCKKMLAKNMDINDIVDCTGLSEEQIEEIKKQN